MEADPSPSSKLCPTNPMPQWAAWLSGLYPQSIGSKGWKWALLEIRIERPVSRTDKSFQQDALSANDRGSMDQYPSAVNFFHRKVDEA